MARGYAARFSCAPWSALQVRPRCTTDRCAWRSPPSPRAEASRSGVDSQTAPGSPPALASALAARAADRAGSGSSWSIDGSSSAPTPAACSVRRRSASTAQARVDDEASQLFLHDLMQGVAVPREIRNKVLKLRVLLAQLPQLAQLAQAQPRVLLLPNVERGFADPVFAADVGHSGAAALPARSALPYIPSSPLRVLIDLVHRTTLAAPTHLSVARFSGFGSPVRIWFRTEGCGLCPPGRECLRRVVGQCAVWTHLVVILPPALELVTHIG